MMPEFPEHACFFLLPRPHGRKPKWSAGSFAMAAGAQLLALESTERARRGDAIAELERKFSVCLANGEEVAVDTSTIRKEEVGHLKNLAKRAYLTPVDVDLDACRPKDGERLVIARNFPDTWQPWLRGPFDVIGDLHDCAEELMKLIKKLGYRDTNNDDDTPAFRHPKRRRLVFVGDFTDRGPRPIETLRIVMGAARDGALAVIGNHDKKLLDYLNGGKVSHQDWFERTATAVGALSENERNAIAKFLANLPSHLVLDDERLVVAHAGCRAAMQGRDNDLVSEFCMYGEGSGTLDKDGYPIRLDWAAEYQGTATVVYGHTTTSRPRWNAAQNAVCIDTGCCLGGALTALRWPERTLVSVPAQHVYTALAGFPRRAA